MSFEKPIQFFREGIGNINYQEPFTAQAPFVNVAGARNGLSVDGSDYIVFGQTVSETGNPAVLLSNREIPQGGFRVNSFGGQIVFSDTQNAGNANSRVSIYETKTGTATGNALYVESTWNTSNISPVSVLFNSINTASGVNASLFRLANNGNIALDFRKDNTLTITDPNAAFSLCATIAPNSIQSGGIPGGGVGVYSCFLSSSTVHPTSGTGIVCDYQSFSEFTEAGGAISFASFLAQPGVSQTAGTGSCWGFYFDVNVDSVTGKLIGFENTSGDCYFNSRISDGFQGRSGFHGIRTPTAYIHIGAGTAAAGQAPLKFSSGPLLTTPEAGAMEFITGQLTFTRTPGTREWVFTSTGTASAPTLNATPVFTNYYGANTNAMGAPTAWGAVNIAGTTYKIPLYI